MSRREVIAQAVQTHNYSELTREELILMCASLSKMMDSVEMGFGRYIGNIASYIMTEDLPLYEELWNVK